ncbi:hypothetical protein HK101_007381 [Irineochytrium annulatum]|nr:hypothetical protein HK101_007381 [Irineochytrium annulatum]
MDVIPKLAEWAKQGEQGKKKSAQLTRYLTIGLALIQAFDYILIAIVLTAGTSFLMWLGEQITEKGIGNGISILIFAGILSTVPNIIKQTIESDFIQPDQLFMNILKGVIIAIVIVLIIIGVIYIQQAIRKIPVQYAKRVVGNKISRLGSVDRTESDYTQTSGYVTMNPQQMADNMKKNGGYIPGIRPGKATEKYLTRVMTRLTMAGAIFLAVISVLPVFLGALSGLPQSAQIGGTSLLIVIGVALDTMKQIESQLIKRHYKGFINK